MGAIEEGLSLSSYLCKECLFLERIYQLIHYVCQQQELPFSLGG